MKDITKLGVPKGLFVYRNNSLGQNVYPECGYFERLNSNDHKTNHEKKV